MYNAALNATFKTHVTAYYCSNLNGPIILHSIGKLKTTDAIELHSVGYWFVEPPEDPLTEDFNQMNYLGRCSIQEVLPDYVLATDLHPSMLLMYVIATF